MNDEKNAVTDSTFEDYKNNFMPSVHRIGRITMIVAFILCFFPILYFYFAEGFKLPATNYISVTIAIASTGIGLWLTEPLSYWPTLGSAGTYMAYLSGNVGNMRFPVALAVQSASKTDINTPKGQILTIIGIAASVFANLCVIFIIVSFGTVLLSILPAPVVSAFGFVMPCLYGAMFVMRFTAGSQGIAKNAANLVPYLAVAICVKLIVKSTPSLVTYGTALSVGATIICAYIRYRIKLSKTS